MASIPTDWQHLTRDDIRRMIADHLHDDPADFAIRHQGNDFPYALVSTQLKYLQRAQRKLPSWYAVQAIIPPLAYEQCSSEATAALKPIDGTRGLDLTLGLGVDSHYLARQAREITGLEAHADLAGITRYNYGLLGQTRVAVQAISAEPFLQAYDASPFDWIYADPARRDMRGKRVQGLAQGQPDLTTLWPDLRRVGRRLLVKASPLLDLRAIPRLLPGLRKVSVHSVQQEVKEVLCTFDLGTETYPAPEDVTLQIVRTDGTQPRRYPLADWAAASAWPAPPTTPRYLAEPDPAFYQAQVLPQLLAQHLADWDAGLSGRLGYYLSQSAPPVGFPGRVFVIEENWRYQPKALKKALRQRHLRRAHVMRRDLPLTVQQMRQQLGVQEGGDAFLIGLTLRGEKRLLLARRI